MNDLHLIQWRDEEQHSSVLCAKHRPDTLSALRELNLGCVGMPAPEGATCDGCRTESLR